MEAIQSLKKELRELAALKYTPWYRWHPQIALRYLPVVERIREEGRRKKEEGIQRRTLSVLEVGSGGLGIVPYLRQPVTGVDVQFEPPFHPLLNRVVGDGTKLKIKDNSFDVVISVDMLEHVPKEKREKAMVEMVRIAKKAVIVGVPCGKKSQAHDEKIQDRYKRQHGKGFPFAEEHLRFGLPDETDILHYIKVASKKAGKSVTIEVKGNLNLQLREFLMWGWMSENFFVNILFRKVFLLLIPFFRAIDRPPYYRQIFFIQILKGPTLAGAKVGP